jgi:hypothetical protein
MTQTLTYDQVTNWLYSTDIEFDQASDVIYADYSGRGMYGEQCFGLVLSGWSDNQDFSDFLLAVADEDRELANHLSHVVSQDALGLRSIFYFPGVKVVDVP